MAVSAEDGALGHLALDVLPLAARECGDIDRLRIGIVVVKDQRGRMFPVTALLTAAGQLDRVEFFDALAQTSPARG